MKYVVLLILAIISFGTSRLILWLANPNDPEGTNLLITSVVAIVVFAPLSLTYLLVFKKRQTKK